MSSNRCNIVAEIGINHNGDINIAKELIDIAKQAGCDYVKIQKRDPDICVPEHMKDIMRDTPWGMMRYLEYKKKIEFNEQDIIELINYSNNLGIQFFASVWDISSVDLMSKYTDIGKIPSALITDIELCQYARSKFNLLIISTGMSTEEEVKRCIDMCDPDVIMHTNSTYPAPVEELNLKYITYLKIRYPDKEIGYSGHEFGLITTFGAYVLGATWIERHVTLNREMWGSDQLSSVEPVGIFKLVTGIRDLEKALQYPVGPRILFDKEKVKRTSLRNFNT